MGNLKLAFAIGPHPLFRGPACSYRVRDGRGVQLELPL